LQYPLTAASVYLSMSNFMSVVYLLCCISMYTNDKHGIT